MKNKPYSEAELQTIRDMRADDKSIGEIAEKLGRDKAALNQKWIMMKKKKVDKPTAKHINKKISPKSEAPAHRPMIALIGTPDEVKTTIKELFS